MTLPTFGQPIARLADLSLDELADMNIVAPAAGQILIWDGVDSWDNRTVSGVITINATGVTAFAAEIPVAQLADGAARQVLQTDAAGTGVEWTDNVDLPGTLDVSGLATFDVGANVITGNVDMSSQGEIQNIGVAGQTITSTGFAGVAGEAGNIWTATAIALVSVNVGATISLRVANIDNTNAASHARVIIDTGGPSGGDPVVDFQVAGIAARYQFGMDSASGIGVISRGTTVGVDDVIRFSNASPPVITYNTAHPTGTFDFACDVCGKHQATEFTCCGIVEWHDDVMDFRSMALREPAALDYMEHVGVIQRGFDKNGEPEEFTRLGADFHFAMSAAFQNRERMDEQFHNLDKRLAAIGA